MAHDSRAVLVTGCSSGIGRATAALLRRSGWVVYATARRTETLTDLVGAGCVPLRLDVTDDDSCRAAVAAVEEQEGAVGVLVNNAGFSQSGPVEQVPVDDARRQFETNFFGPARLTQLVLPAMRAQRWGRIVNISSMGGRLTFPGGGYYHATKYALEALSDALRFEVAGFGVDVVLVEPGFIRTGFAEAAAASMPAAGPGDGTDTAARATEDDPYREFNAGLLRSTREVYRRGPLARLAGTPDDVARVVLEAVTAARPRARYPVTASARVLRAMRVALPDRAWDAVVGRQFTQPGRSDG
ncbi:MAG TPA: SDR family NAD(P)-dependent oxidoreductase [Acidimicrobiales bacterium]|nr:SDR family NAD(P)-dependent oxidoreductase [Acidimicrobiales bacterium]